VRKLESGCGLCKAAQPADQAEAPRMIMPAKLCRKCIVAQHCVEGSGRHLFLAAASAASLRFGI
jgi:hypothetical protein